MTRKVKSSSSSLLCCKSINNWFFFCLLCFVHPFFFVCCFCNRKNWTVVWKFVTSINSCPRWHVMVTCACVRVFVWLQPKFVFRFKLSSCLCFLLFCCSCFFCLSRKREAINSKVISNEKLVARISSSIVIVISIFIYISTSISSRISITMTYNGRAMNQVSSSSRSSSADNLQAHLMEARQELSSAAVQNVGHNLSRLRTKDG